MASRSSRSNRSGRIRIIPKHKPEPDLDQVVLALLAMLDEQDRASSPIRDAHGNPEGDAS